MTSLRWATQQPSKVATVSQIAAPEDGEVKSESAWGPTPLATPAALESGDSFADRSPQGWRGLI